MVKKGGQLNRSKHNQRMNNDYRNRNQMRPQQSQQRQTNGASYNGSSTNGAQRPQSRFSNYQSAPSNSYQAARPYTNGSVNSVQKPQQTYQRPAQASYPMKSFDANAAPVNQARIPSVDQSRFNNNYAMKSAVAPMYAQQQSYQTIMPGVASFNVPPPMYSYPPPQSEKN